MSETTVGTLCDNDIKSMCDEGLLIEENFDPQRIKQACYELRCGYVYYDLSEKKQQIRPKGRI